MECVICKRGQTRPGTATVTVKRNSTVLVIKGVPADICANCGEEYVGEATGEDYLYPRHYFVSIPIQRAARAALRR